MNWKNKTVIVLLAVLLLTVSGILYVKQQFWKAQPADAVPIKQKERTPLDLRPAAIAKLQQLVQAASDSLYKLRIDSLFTELTSGTIVLRGIGLYPDSNAIHRLHSLQRLPDDVFRIELKSLRISGIGLDDIIHRRDIHLQSVSCNTPRIIVYHKAQPYNADECAATNARSLYARIKNQIDKLAIDSISLRQGVLIDYAGRQKNIFNELSLLLCDILIDSAAEKDRSRCLFAKKMQLDAGSITLSDGNYDLTMGGLSVNGPQQQVRVRNFAMLPRGGREAVARRQKERGSIFTIRVPEMTLKGANWWAAVNRESIIAEEANVHGARVEVYVDQHVPPGPIQRSNFPQQKLMDVDMRVSLKQVSVNGASLICEEFSAASNKVGRMLFSNLFLVAEGVTNIPSEVAARPVVRIKGDCRFMNTTPLTGIFALDLPKNKRGGFRVDVTMGALGHEIVNRFSEALGLVRFPSGQMQSAKGHIEGNNDVLKGKVSIRYSDLHLEPLKYKNGDSSRLKEKHISGKIANILFVKDNNPSRGALREPDFSLSRTTESNFFAFTWEGLKLGLLKTIGVPPKLGAKK
jgi:hypothetical protein